MKVSKIILRGKEARKKLQFGVNFVADIVGKTMGPSGRNAILGTIGAQPPKITNDGVSIAREVILQDELENLGAQSLINAAKMTNDRVGDGTSTCTVLAREIFNEGLEKIDDEHSLVENDTNVMDLYRQIDESKKAIVETLEKQAKPIKTKADIKKIALTSVENEEIAEKMSEMLHKLGKDAVITTEPGYNHEIESEITKGMKTHSTYATELLVTNDRKEAIKKDTDVIVTNQPIENPQQLLPLVTLMSKDNKNKLVLIAPSFAKEVLPTIVVNKAKGIFDILAVKAPALTDAELEDMAVYADSKFIDKNQDQSIEKAQLEDLGFVHKIVVDENNAVMMEGKGNVNERIKLLKAEMEEENTEMMQTKYAKRIASLTGSIGVIRVGAKSDIERKYLKDKVDDAIHATKAAMDLGVVKGGGLALKEIADTLKDEDVLKKPITKPYEQIQENSGSGFEVGEEVIDPVKVTIVALENACSVAGILLTTDTLIADKNIKDLDESFKDMLREILGEDG